MTNPESLHHIRSGGMQRNHDQHGGSYNRQYNAERIAIHEITQLAQERVETPPPPCLHLPFRRDRDYVDRPALAAEIHAKLAVPAARVALVGLGGVGSRSNTVAEVVKIRGRHDAKTEIFALVWVWLRDSKGGKRWLIVLDNVDDASFLLEPPVESSDAGRERRIDYLPVCDHGSILVTSRSVDEARRIVQYAADVVKVRAMEMGDAVALLERKLGDQHSRTDMASLAETLECIPLAMTQASSYIVQRGKRCTVQRYLEKLRRRNVKSVLGEAAPDHRRDREAQNAIWTTWQISFEHVYYTRRSAADLLSVMSFCDRQAIPEKLLQMCMRTSSIPEKAVDGELDNSMADDVEIIADTNSGEEYKSDGSSAQSLADNFDRDVAMLEGYSFVASTVDASVLEMHRLVQEAMRQWLQSRGLSEEYLERFLAGLDEVFPVVSYENWDLCQTLFPHARAASQQRPKRQRTGLQWANIMFQAGWYAKEQGNIVDAFKMPSGSVMRRESILGVEHPDTLTSVNDLALVLQNQGKYEAAEEMNRRALEGYEKVLGAEHPSTLTSMDNLAGVLRNQGKYESAEEMNRRALEGREKVLGAEHPETLISVQNLAHLVHQRHDTLAALPLYERACAGYTKALGAAHPTTRSCAAHMASLRDQIGKS